MKKNEKGFTLVELMVVLAILGLLFGAVGIAVYSWIGKGEKKRVQMDFHTIGNAIDSYRLDTGHFPNSMKDLVQQSANDEKWAGPYIKDSKMPMDPWNHPYQLKVPGSGGARYEIITLGADGRPGGNNENADLSSVESRRR